jgi:DNA mismatch endonuclease (patch repair protein)
MATRNNVRGLPGSPDVVVPRIRLAVFADGCFFHMCPIHGRLPKSRVDFWRRKLEGNVRRDRSTRRALRALGWTVWSIWEHDLKDGSVARTSRLLRRRMARILRKVEG